MTSGQTESEACAASLAIDPTGVIYFPDYDSRWPSLHIRIRQSSGARLARRAFEHRHALSRKKGEPRRAIGLVNARPRRWRSLIPGGLSSPPRSIRAAKLHGTPDESAASCRSATAGRFRTARADVRSAGRKGHNRVRRSRTQHRRTPCIVRVARRARSCLVLSREVPRSEAVGRRACRRPPTSGTRGQRLVARDSRPVVAIDALCLVVGSIRVSSRGRQRIARRVLGRSNCAARRPAQR